VRTFSSGQEAKEYLIAQITFAAESEGTPLSETERKMMYFTESAWAPSDMRDVNEVFERDYDTPSYEAKVAKIAATAQSRAAATGELSTWKEASGCYDKKITICWYSSPLQRTCPIPY